MASESTISVFSDVSDVNDFPPCRRECPTPLTNEVSMKNREEGKKKKKRKRKKEIGEEKKKVRKKKKGRKKKEKEEKKKLKVRLLSLEA